VFVSRPNSLPLHYPARELIVDQIARPARELDSVMEFGLYQAINASDSLVRPTHTEYLGEIPMSSSTTGAPNTNDV